MHVHKANYIATYTCECAHSETACVACTYWGLFELGCIDESYILNLTYKSEVDINSRLS